MESTNIPEFILPAESASLDEYEASRQLVYEQNEGGKWQQKLPLVIADMEVKQWQLKQ